MNTIFAATILLLLSQQPTIPSATLEGRILHPDNSPAAGMKVELLQQIVNTEGMRQWLTVERRQRDHGRPRTVPHDRVRTRQILPSRHPAPP
jgi:hypothetical protein